LSAKNSNLIFFTEKYAAAGSFGGGSLRPLLRRGFGFYLPLAIAVWFGFDAATAVAQRAGAVVSTVPAETIYPPVDSPFPNIARLGHIPDWSVLESYQKTITREEFTYLLNHCYARKVSDYTGLIEIQHDRVLILKQSNYPRAGWFVLQFKPGLFRPPGGPRYWRPALEQDDLPENSTKPLAGIRIVLDPGHIGGIWHTWDDRNFKIGRDAMAVQEGRMTLKVARILERDLTILGAEVYLTRSELEPVTPLRVTDFQGEARSYLVRKHKVPSSGLIASTAKKMFAISSEIRTRAELVNDSMRPDLALCLHFNASPWSNPRRPSFKSANHLHVMINGCYSHYEISEDDTRLEMLLRILRRTYYEELKLADVLADTMADETGLPAFHYNGISGKSVDDNEYVWARNLLANRIFSCPVIYFEPYCMNQRDVYARIQAGEYEGFRKFNGVYRKNIYQEYADGVTSGLVRYYRRER